MMEPRAFAKRKRRAIEIAVSFQSLFTFRSAKYSELYLFLYLSHSSLANRSVTVGYRQSSCGLLEWLLHTAVETILHTPWLFLSVTTNHPTDSRNCLPILPPKAILHILLFCFSLRLCVFCSFAFTVFPRFYRLG